ncbi:MAG: hypothetical protein P8M53_09645 [Pirellulales bacterium]|nr:hypothetical protein [Pirellulales bacterium]
MSQTTGKRTNTAQSTPSVDELAALEKLEAAQLLAEQCKALDEIGPESEKAIAWREALQLWLRWNQAHEQITKTLFEDGKPSQKLEDVMDHLDRMRKQAVSLSEGLIG